jgi:multidrug resistance efflux pump
MTMIRKNNIRSTMTYVPTKSKTTIHLVQSSQFAQRLARLLVVGLFASILAMALLPWQQSSRGSGQVVAYVPQERQQTIQARVKGVVSRIAIGMIEGSEVKKGDFILEIQPIAANLQEQLNAQIRDLQTQLTSANAKTTAYEDQVKGFTEAGEYTVKAASEMVDSAKDKLESKRKLRSGYTAKELQARLNYDRQKSLFDSGIKPEKEIEKLKKEWDVAHSELQSIYEDVASLEKELTAKEHELEEKRLLAKTKIDYAVAMREDANGSAAKIQKEKRDIELKLEELRGLIITAPRDGTIFRMPVYEQGQTIKEGDPIITIVPETTQNAVELWVPGNDMPLVQIGQEARLQFEGWPAVQFPGWPSVAVGTFSGTVVNVDATDNGKGQFRVLILPNENDKIQWPSDRYLRQGVRVNGWIMLQEVMLGYEMWRQLNGFPVIISDEPPGKSSSKPPKIPK